MRKQTKYWLTFTLIMTSCPMFGQAVEMADRMRSDGKIYVVVSIILVILAGFITYLISMGRKMSRLEKRLSEHLKTK